MNMLRAFALLAIIVTLSGCSSFAPFEGQVSQISVALHNRPDGGVTIQEFVVPSSHHKKVLRLFDGAASHRSQIDWAVLGELKVTMDSGVVDMWLFSAGEKMVFKPKDGGSYETTSLSKFIRTIEEAKAASTEN